MPVLNFSQAAIAAGISRSTLLRHVAKGQLSVSRAVYGTEGVDTSGLARHYGTLAGTSPTTPVVHPESVSQTTVLQQEIQLLKDQVKLYQQVLEAPRARENKLLDVITQKLLAPREPVKTKVARKPASKLASRAKSREKTAPTPRAAAKKPAGMAPSRDAIRDDSLVEVFKQRWAERNSGDRESARAPTRRTAAKAKSVPGKPAKAPKPAPRRAAIKVTPHRERQHGRPENAKTSSTTGMLTPRECRGLVMS